MDIVMVLLLILVIAAVIAATFAIVRTKQRSGSVLAATDTDEGQRGRK